MLVMNAYYGAESIARCCPSPSATIASGAKRISANQKMFAANDLSGC